MPLTHETRRPALTNPSVLVATWFGSGYLPKMPGTWGSLAALPCAWGIAVSAGPNALWLAGAVLFAVGIWAANGYMAISGTHDPGPVVVDEVAGQWLVLGILPPDPFMYALGFAVFRLYDILKPWPVNVLDQRLKGGLGIMMDDVLAAVYGIVTLYLILAVAALPQ